MKSGRTVWAGVGAFLAWSVVFAFLYAQSPLFTSNQNQYFLHGLARAGLGGLGRDWLAGTPDPTPVFSGLVWLTYSLTGSSLPFYAYYALLMGVYLLSAFGLMDLLFGLRRSPSYSLLFVVLFLGAHSAALRYLFSHLVGPGATFLLEGGVAGQRLLGQVFQPSTFAVFLVLSLYLFLAGRRNWAILPLVVAVSVHPTYLLAGGLLTLTYLWVILRQTRRWKAALLYGLKVLVPVLPILAYTLLNFHATNPGVYAEAQNVLVHFRIPAHAVVGEWLDWTVAVQSAFVAAGLLVLRRKPLFPIYAGLAAGALLLTLVQVASGSNTLALVFPWRISVVLVPLGVSILLAALVGRIMGRWPPSARTDRRLRWLSLAALGALVAVGVLRFQIEYGRYHSNPARPLMESVAASEPAADIYLVPVKWSTFRLLAQAPIYVDFVSIPYRDVDLREWYHRLRLAGWFYGSIIEPCAALAQFTDQAGVTRVVLPAGHPAAACPGLTLVYQDDLYSIYSLQP